MCSVLTRGEMVLKSGPMKRCPFCGVDNHDSAAVCYNCGRDLSAVSPSEPNPSPTQPLRPRPQSTQPVPPYYPPQNDPNAQGAGPYYYPPAQNQPPTYARASYPPPPVPPAQRSRGGCTWSLLGAVLGLALICVIGLVLLSLTGVAGTLGSRLKGQLATQVVNTFSGATPTPQATSPFAEETPTPWPTLTTQPGSASLPTESGPTTTPDATQQAYVNKLISSGCRTALDTLGQESNTVTQNPLKLLDDTWRAGFTQAITAMRTNCGTLDSASPVPGEVSKLSQTIALANSTFDQAKQLWTEAVNTRDPSKAIQAAQKIGSATQYLSQALAILKTLSP